MSNTCRIGVGGPVGSGKTALIEAITPYFLKLGLSWTFNNSSEYTQCIAPKVDGISHFRTVLKTTLHSSFICRRKENQHVL